MGSPAVRARHPKYVLASAAARPDGGRALRALVDPEVLRRIEDASPLEWLPIEVDVAVARAAHGALGAGGAREFYRDLFREACRSPLLGPVLESAKRMYGAERAAYAKLIPAGWGVMLRDCGTWRIEPDGPGRVDLVLEWLPPACVDHPAWIDGVAASFSAMLEAASVRATVERILLEAGSRSAVLALLWEADAELRALHVGKP
jgi:hypothetical protein